MRRRGSRAGVAGIALAAAFWLAPALSADQVVVAFGDSITKGAPPNDEENKGGYPGRLQRILRRADAGLDDVRVLNFGVAGEATAVGL
ncbi:MAG: arylesterase, partial [Thermoanaerobaculia bacterium]